ncbi:DUF1361 domain-containing protein [uncultured Ilyobacter sp.]|uniref:DUF1361 domain-containing protein n=1 Tax=uncultured Ilyobacter sp. TaxID=544433 RepID=UPI00374867F2
MVAVRTLVTLNAYYIFLIWNLFLAWIPMFLSLILIIKGIHKITQFFVGMVWIIFYPNASYFITDFIHISRGGYHLSHKTGIDVIVWYDFLMISLFVFTGMLLGFLSLYLLHKKIEKKFSIQSGWRFVVAVQILSSYGIYLGRFIRLNSWHILTKPSDLVKSILMSFNLETLIFVIILCFFLTLIYVALYNISQLSRLD